MSLETLLVSIGLTIAVVGAALVYLRGITQRVLHELCASDAGAAFWLRSTDILALAGSLVLVLAFGGIAGAADWATQLRLTLGLALGGLFATVLVVAASVWRNVPPTEARQTLTHDGTE